MTYKQWLDAVAKWLDREWGADLKDMPDPPTRDWFDNEVSPKEAAERIGADSW